MALHRLRTQLKSIWLLNITINRYQDPLFLNNLLQPIKRYFENGKRRGSKQYIPISLRSLPIVNDQSQPNPLSSKPMINQQPESSNING